MKNIIATSSIKFFWLVFNVKNSISNFIFFLKAFSKAFVKTIKR